MTKERRGFMRISPRKSLLAALSSSGGLLFLPRIAGAGEFHSYPSVPRVYSIEDEDDERWNKTEEQRYEADKSSLEQEYEANKKTLEQEYEARKKALEYRYEDWK